MNNHITTRLTRFGCLAALAVGSAISVHAQSGVWTNNAAGNWSDTTQWLNGIVASGTGTTADFSTINITAARTVTLDQPFTVGVIKESDAATPIVAWTLAGGLNAGAGTGGQTLTLDNSGSTPIINVVNAADTFNLASMISSTTGLQKNGLGIFDVQAYLTYTGNLVLNGGMIQVDPRAALTAGTATAEAFETNMFPLADLIANGGAFNIRLGTDQSYYQFFNNINLVGGDTVILGSRSSGGQYFEMFTNVIRSAGATVRLSPNTGKTGNEEIFLTTAPTNNPFGVILPAISVTGTTDWTRVINTNGEIGAATAYGPTNFFNTNTTVTTNFAVATNGNHTYTLAFRTAAALTLTLNGANVIDTGGILVSSAVGAFGSTITGGTSLSSGNGADLIVQQWNNPAAGALTIASPIVDNPTNGAIALTKSGDGNLILTAVNSYNGNTYVNNGTLTVGNGTTVGSIATSPAIITGYGENTAISAGTFGTLAFNHSDTVTLPVVVSGSGGLTQAGGGTLVLAANDTYSGPTTVNAGILQVGDAATHGSMSNSSTVVDSAALVFNRTDNIGYAGIIGGIGSLTKNGSGTLSLGGVSTYTGNTVISAGTLQLLAATTTNPISGSVSISVAQGATLDASAVPSFSLAGSAPTFQALSGSGVVMGTVAVVSGSSLSPGTIGTVGTITLTNNLALSGGTLNLDVVSGGASDLIAVGGNVALNAGSVALTITGTLANGAYPIIKYKGAVSGNPLSLSVSGFLQAGQVASISTNIPGEVDLLVSRAGTPLTWVGDNSINAWDVGQTTNFSNGTSLVVFNNNDLPTFDDTGSQSPPVAIMTNVQPASVTVNTANTYTFTDGTGAGNGSIVGSATLTKSGAGTLIVETIDGNSGATTINGGTIQVGNNSVSGSLGSGQITNNGSLVYEQPDSQPIVGVISGSGSVTQSGSATLQLVANNTYTGGTLINSGTLQVGVGSGSGTLGNSDVTNNAALDFNRTGSVTFSHIISGGGSLTNDLGTLTLSGNNSYFGGTTVNGGTLKIGNINALGGPSGGLTVNGGIVDLNANNITVASLAGTGGVVENNTGAATNTLSVVLSGTSEFGGVIADNAGSGGKVALFVSGGGNLRLDAVNTYSGGTIVDTNTTLSTGASGQMGTAGIIMSNNATFAMPTATSTSAQIGNNFTTVDNATANFTSGETADALNGQFIGSALATNVFPGNISLAGTLCFSNFLGRVIFSSTSSGEVRFNNNAPAAGGGDNTIFDLEGGGFFPRNSSQIDVGALTGTGLITGPSNPGTTPAILAIGLKGMSTIYSGSISGFNSLVKLGGGSLTLNDILVDGTFTDNSTFTNTLYDPASQVSYTGNTTVSNGVLALIVPNSLTNSPVITLAGSSAVLDASAMGYVSNIFDENSILTNTVLVTNGILEILNTNVLGGVGTIHGTLLADAGSVLNPGNVITNNSTVAATNVVAIALTNIGGTGLLTITGPASIFGSVNILLNRTNTVNCGELSAQSFTIDPGASLFITNIGPALQGGDVFHLFNHAVNFANVTLPTVPSNIVLSNKLAIDGSLQIVSLVNTNATNVMVSYNNTTGVGSVTWPSDHTGWRLQTQTNAPGIGVTTNWVTVVGSTNVNTVSFTNVPGNGSVFFRMVYP